MITYLDVLYSAEPNLSRVERMANEEHLAVLKRGVTAWNEWRSEHREIVPDLREAKLYGAELIGADLRAAHLRSADLIEANLREANLGASVMGYTSVVDVDLSGVNGLETVKHLGPSSIGIDTIYRSKGNIPEVFLRGAGVPNNFIAYMKSLAGTLAAFEYYSCFISYSSKDEAFAKCLYVDLQSNGVRCWFAPHDMRSGQKLHEQIDEAIRLHERLLLILSPDSMNE